MSAFDEIKSLLDTMAARKDELAKFEGLLSEVSVALGDIVSLMERPGKVEDDSAIVSALIDGLRGLSIKAPDVQVNVAPAQVSVAAPHVTVQAPSSPHPSYTVTVTGFDGNGNIRTLSIKPEN